MRIRLFSLLLMALTGMPVTGTMAETHVISVPVESLSEIKLSEVLEGLSFAATDRVSIISEGNEKIRKKIRLAQLYWRHNRPSNPVGRYDSFLSEYNGDTLCHFIPSDTIYIVRKGSSVPEPFIVVDFGEYAFKDNLCYRNSNIYEKYLLSHYKYAGYVENVSVSGNVIYLTYWHNDARVHLFYNIENGHVINGNLVDDVFFVSGDTPREPQLPEFIAPYGVLQVMLEREPVSTLMPYAAKRAEALSGNGDTEPEISVKMSFKSF